MPAQREIYRMEEERTEIDLELECFSVRRGEGALRLQWVKKLLTFSQMCERRAHCESCNRNNIHGLPGLGTTQRRQSGKKQKKLSRHDMAVSECLKEREEGGRNQEIQEELGYLGSSVPLEKLSGNC
jgi:hypothetical protein